MPVVMLGSIIMGVTMEVAFILMLVPMDMGPACNQLLYKGHAQ